MSLANVFSVPLTHCVLNETFFHFQHTKGNVPKKWKQLMTFAIRLHMHETPQGFIIITKALLTFCPSFACQTNETLNPWRTRAS